ncbi:MAG: TldD/PmbA family protein [Candidatus Cryptobacteroides sp.]
MIYKGIEDMSCAISDAEARVAENSVEAALDAGASAVQVTLDKACTDIVALLNGELDNIRHTGDRSLTFRLYSEGRYGIFSTNRLDDNEIRSFMKQAVEHVRLQAEDPFRKLPAETTGEAVRGDEMGLCWYDYDTVTGKDRIDATERVSVFGKEGCEGDGWKLISEEVEYNNTLADTLFLDSSGTRCRQVETSFEISAQATVQDSSGARYSGLYWDYGISPDTIRGSECGRKAVVEAVSQIGPERIPGGKYTMVVDRRVCGKLIGPVIGALGGLRIQQRSSFLTDTLDKKIFQEGMSLVDRPRVKGKCGSILFEPDGRACIDRDIIIDGVVKEYFINTYISGKMGMEPTSDTANRPVLLPYVNGNPSLTGTLRRGEGVLDRDGILRLCGDGILITGFNGGNCNAATGEFSYGIEGFEFRNGLIVKPIESMLITGDMIALWNSLIAAGTDPMNGMSRQIPTLAFSDISFNS